MHFSVWYSNNVSKSLLNSDKGILIVVKYTKHFFHLSHLQVCDSVTLRRRTLLYKPHCLQNFPHLTTENVVQQKPLFSK